MKKKNLFKFDSLLQTNFIILISLHFFFFIMFYFINSTKFISLIEIK